MIIFLYYLLQANHYKPQWQIIKKLKNDEKLSKDRLRKQQEYAEIKNNPELYSLQKAKEKKDTQYEKHKAFKI